MRFISTPALVATGLVSALILSACGTTDSVEGVGSEDDTIVIGSQDYYSNEIIAELYAQALEGAGFQVERQYRIGQREVYMPEIISGSIDLFPEYSGDLLQYLDPEATERNGEDVLAALRERLPEGLRVLQQAGATDQNAFAVTTSFAEEHGLFSIADLAKVDTPLILGANSEAEARPYGPPGLSATYGVDVTFTPIEDGGGPLTVRALQDNDVQLAIMYTANPTIVSNNLELLEDPENLFVASHVLPVASNDITPEAEETINRVSSRLSVRELRALNERSITEQLSAATIAEEWLSTQGLKG